MFTSFETLVRTKLGSLSLHVSVMSPDPYGITGSFRLYDGRVSYILKDKLVLCSLWHVTFFLKYIDNTLDLAFAHFDGRLPRFS